MLVHVGQTEYGLEHDAFDLILGEWLRSVFHKLVNVLLHIFKYEIQVVVYSDHLFELYDESVIQLSQRLDLSKSHALLPRVKLLLHLFDGHFFFALNVDGFNDRAVSSISKGLNNFVPFHFTISINRLNPYGI